ncbi:hypothetical protein J5226_08430 [Lysobacter sp. K5869]|uniref:hypothetical protein n=1 Tax=Lysobacter sp. K5869 TaxID=2820808 RepID=UPI001C06239A|nr:hypothetical protein [Lysobacter sp. K5869]QWP78403.1 hypothetical protein J5226_08430 [Lysobacter sp. K5869]
MSKSIRTRVLPLALCALAAAFSQAAWAEDSQEETPQEERDFAAKLIPMSEAQKMFVEYTLELEKRYPDSAQVDPEKFLNEEGETYALLYCRSLGFEGACVVESQDGVDRFVAYSPAQKVSANTAGKAVSFVWWNWLNLRLFSVGVIPDRSCPSQYPTTWLYHDDEDRRNANSRGGWIGATTSNNNTTWRYCRIDDSRSLSFRPLPNGGNAYDYSVLKLGVFCPSGARTVIRRQNNENWNNQNSNSGPLTIFPSSQGWLFPPAPLPFNGPLPTTITHYCHFDGAAPSWLGYMSSFPNLGFAYGVHAPSAFPKPWALATGWVHQDDEDWFNFNAWWGWPDNVMSGGGNTWRGMARVR